MPKNHDDLSVKGKFQSTLGQYSKNFWFAVIGILAVLAIVPIINYTSIGMAKNILHNSNQKFTDFENGLKEIETELAETTTLTESIYPSADTISSASKDLTIDSVDLSYFTQLVDASLKSKLVNNDNLIGYYLNVGQLGATEFSQVKSGFKQGYSMNFEETLDRSKFFKSQWIALPDKYNDRNILIYIRPFVFKGENIGFCGIIMDNKYFNSMLSKINADKKDTFAVLFNSEASIMIETGVDVTFTKELFHEVFVKENDTIHFKNRLIENISCISGKSENAAFALTYKKLYNELVIATFVPIHSVLHKSYLVLFVLGLTAISCIFLNFRNSKYNMPTYEIICNYIMRKYRNQLMPIDECNIKAAIGMHIGGIVAVFAFAMYAIASDVSLFGKIAISLLLLGVTLLIGGYAINMTRRHTTFGIVMGIVIPVMVHLLTGGYSDGLSIAILWTFMALIQGLFSLKPSEARKVFIAFILILFIDAVIETLVLGISDYQAVCYSISSVMALGFGLYTAVELYIVRSIENYNNTVDNLNKLKNAQSNLVMREKSIILGQLISGVAHEINTPIGAIKASAETMSASLSNTLKAAMKNSKNFTEEEFEIFTELVNLASVSLREMNSTVTIRRAKNALKKYFEEIELESGPEIVDGLVRLEICDMEKIKERIDILKNPKICEILSVVGGLSTLIVGTETIMVATGKVSKIVFALKSYSHNTVSDEHLEMDVIKTIDTVLTLYHNQIKTGIDIVLDYDENIKTIKGNADELSQVWTNLIQNAIYAMGGNGTLTVSAHEENGNLKISVIDTGTGIEESKLVDIFEPFYTTKPLGEGSGLGLDISKKIVEKHKGTIEVSSSIGVGTTFTVRLPVLEDSNTKEGNR